MTTKLQKTEKKFKENNHGKYVSEKDCWKIKRENKRKTGQKIGEKCNKKKDWRNDFKLTKTGKKKRDSMSFHIGTHDEKRLRTSNVTYGMTISVTLFRACFPTIIMNNWMQSSIRQPPGEHSSCRNPRILIEKIIICFSKIDFYKTTCCISQDSPRIFP